LQIRHDSTRIERIKRIFFQCGSPQLFLISGPCVIEEPTIMLKTAEVLKQVEERLHIPIIYKSSFMKDNRSSVDYYVIISDIHYPSQIEAAAEVLDIIQIPAYLCMQTSLTVGAAKTGKPINLKHGQFLAPENMVKPIQKIEAQNNQQILLTERGYTFGYNDLVVDPRSFYHFQETGYPVIFDVTHSIRKYGIHAFYPKVWYSECRSEWRCEAIFTRFGKGRCGGRNRWFVYRNTSRTS